MADYRLDVVQQAIVDSPEGQRLLKEMRDKAVEAAIENCPVDTGDLRDSIKGEITEDGEVKVSCLYYGLFVDRGHGGYPAKPFMSGSAIDAAKKVVKE